MKRFLAVLAAFALATIGVAHAEEALPNQDQALARALVNHPDIVAAKAKVALAEAELYGKRMEVSRQIIELCGSVKMLDAQMNAARAALSGSMVALGSAKQAADTKLGADPAAIGKLTAEVQGAEAQLVRLAAQKEQTEKELSLLIGSATPAVESPAATKRAAARQAPQGPIVDQVKASLEAPIKLDFVDMPLSDVLTILSENKLGVKFSLQVAALESAGIGSDEPATIKTNEVRLRDAIQAFEDDFPLLQFVVRDYGVLLTTRDYAREHGYTPLLELGKESVSTH